MTIAGKSPFSIGHTYSNGGFSIVMLVFGGGKSIQTPHFNWFDSLYLTIEIFSPLFESQKSVKKGPLSKGEPGRSCLGVPKKIQEAPSKGTLASLGPHF